MNHKLLFKIFIIILLITLGGKVICEDKDLQYISYIESSNGLETPTLDGGRTEVEMVDINLDGQIDLISIGDHGNPYVNTQEHGVMVYFGNGAGSWSVYQYGNFGYGGIAVGDINKDGYLDIAYGMHHNYSGDDLGDQVLEAALGNGTGQYWTAWDDNLGLDGQTWGMFETDLADIDNDGDLDIGSNSFGCCDGKHVYRNNLDGTWTHVHGTTGGNSQDFFIFGDVNCDGLTDYAVGHQYGTIYLGDGEGNFYLADGNLPPAGYTGREGISLNDANGDGCDDLAFVNSNGGVEVWAWAGSNIWNNISGSLPISGSYEATQLADMNMDGFVDLVAFGYGTCTIWLRDSNGNWIQATQFSTPTPGYFAAFRTGLDADHNGYPDIVIVAEEGGPFNSKNRLRFFKEASIPANLAIYPIAPSQNEVYYAGSVHFIKWTAAIPSGHSSVKVSLELSLNGPDGPWQTIASNLPENGIYQWHLSPMLPSSNNAYIKYIVSTNLGGASTISFNHFKIIGTSISQNPAEAGKPMTCFKSGINSVTCNYTNGGSCATNNTIYYGDLSNVSSYNYLDSICDIGTSGTYTFQLPDGNLFWVIVSNNGAKEGSYGKDSNGIERQEASGVGLCDYPQDLNNTCE